MPNNKPVLVGNSQFHDPSIRTPESTSANPLEGQTRAARNRARKADDFIFHDPNGPKRNTRKTWGKVPEVTAVKRSKADPWPSTLMLKNSKKYPGARVLTVDQGHSNNVVQWAVDSIKEYEKTHPRFAVDVPLYITFVNFPGGEAAWPEAYRLRTAKRNRSWKMYVYSSEKLPEKRYEHEFGPEDSLVPTSFSTAAGREVAADAGPSRQAADSPAAVAEADAGLPADTGIEADIDTNADNSLGADTPTAVGNSPDAGTPTAVGNSPDAGTPTAVANSPDAGVESADDTAADNNADTTGHGAVAPFATEERRAKRTRRKESEDEMEVLEAPPVKRARLDAPQDVPKDVPPKDVVDLEVFTNAPEASAIKHTEAFPQNEEQDKPNEAQADQYGYQDFDIEHDSELLRALLGIEVDEGPVVDAAAWVLEEVENCEVALHCGKEEALYKDFLLPEGLDSPEPTTSDDDEFRFY